VSAARHLRALVALVAGVVVLALAGAHVASAAGMELAASGGRAWVSTSARCQSGQLAITTTATGATTSVQVTGVQAACVGKALTVTLYDPSVTSSSAASRRFTGTATAAATTTVTGGTFTPTSALVPVVTVDGWRVDATWSWAPAPSWPAVSCTVPAAPQTPCTVTVTSTNQWGTPAAYYQWALTVTTTSPVPVAWQVTFNLSDPAFPFLAGALQDVQGGLVLVSASACSASPRLVTVSGTRSWGGYHEVRAGTSASMQVQGERTGTGNLLTCR